MTELLTISRLGHRGDGITDTPQGAIYTPYTLPGETVEAEPVQGHPDRRHLLRVVTASAERIPPICAHFGICGGCAIQHWSEPRYRAWKRDLVVGALAQIDCGATVENLIDAHGEGRRRAVLHARRSDHGVLEVGFAALRAHHLVAIDKCPVLAPSLDGAINTAWVIAECLKPRAKPLDIHVTATNAGHDIDVRGSGPLSAQLMTKLAAIAEKERLARLTRHGELIVKRAAPTITIGRASVILPPGAFLQATIAGEETLARLVCEHTIKAKTIADLFAGIGPFALRLAETARVTAADSDAAALAALSRAAATTAGLKPVTTEKRDLFRRPFVAQELKNFDAVIFDPPRQGAEAQARALVESSVPRVVAVSCNPSTFARDAKILIDGGYRLGAVVPVDQFRHTAHVEIVACFDR